VLDGPKRQQVINALAQHVFLVDPRQVRPSPPFQIPLPQPLLGAGRDMCAINAAK
jgi:hypothetical protein